MPLKFYTTSEALDRALAIVRYRIKILGLDFCYHSRAYRFVGVRP